MSVGATYPAEHVLTLCQKANEITRGSRLEIVKLRIAVRKAMRCGAHTVFISGSDLETLDNVLDIIEDNEENQNVV